MNQSCKCKCASPEVCILNHIKNLDIHVTLEDKQRWNNAAQKSSGKDIDIDKYSTTEEVKRLIKDYVDNKGFITDIPEYYETEEEVLLLLDTTLQDYTKREVLDEILIQYMPLAQFQEFEQQLYQYLQQLKEDILENSKHVTQLAFNEDTRMFHLTQSDGEILSVEIPGGGGGGGDTPASYMQYNASAYVNVTNGTSVNTPIGGSYDFNTYSLIPPHDPHDTSGTITWKGSMSGMTVDENHSIYVSNRTFNSDPNAPTTTWSSPILFSGSIKTETNTETYEYYSTEVSRVFIVYHTGEVKETQDPTTGKYSYKSTPPKEVYAAPQGGQYDKSQDQLTIMPHTRGYDSDLWSLTLPEPGEYTIPNHNDNEQQQTITKSIYFSIGQVSESSIEWSQPAIYGTDYVSIASNMKFIAIDYSLLAENITLTSADLNVVAKNVVLNQDQLRIIADSVNIDSSFTTFRGDVNATKFTVFKDNAYWTKDSVSGKVLKNTDIDQKLFSIALNKQSNSVYDPTSADDDVLMLFYNPGVLTEHETGTEENGGGSRGTLTDNVLTYTVNPKYISQNRSISYSCALDVEDNEQDSEFLSYFTDVTIDEYTAGSVLHKAPYVNNSIWGSFPIAALTREQESNTIVLPDPKINNGLIIKGKVNCNFKLNNTGPLLPQGYTGNDCSNSDEALTQVANQIAVLYNIYYEDARRNGTTQVSWETVCENGLPRITIDTNSDFRFVQINGYDDDYIQRDPTLRDYLNRGILSLDQDFYNDFAQSVEIFFGENYFPLWATTATYDRNADRYGESQAFNSWSDHMHYIGKGTGESNNQVQYPSRGIFILPSCTGLWKIANGIPLEYTATAVKESLLNVSDRNNIPWDCNVYYWKINTEDFIVYGSQEYLAGTGATCVRLVPFDEWKMSSVDNTITAMFNDEGDINEIRRLLQEDVQKLCYNTNIMIQRIDYLSYLLVHMNDGRNNYPERIKTFIENCVKPSNA